MLNNKVLIYALLTLLLAYSSADAMKNLTSAPALFDQHDERGKTPLHRAVIEHDIPTIQELLEHGAKLSRGTKASTIEAPDFMRNKIGYTIFHLAACKHGEYGERLKKLLLYYALLQNTPALLDALKSPLYDQQLFAVTVLQDRAHELKTILAMKNAEGDTAAEIERKRDEFGKPLPYHGNTPLFSAFKVNTDLRAFVAAVQFGNVALLPSNNIFKAAHDAMPNPQ